MEIMITVTIIGLLLAIAIPNYVKAREGARSKSCRLNLRQIQAAKDRWAMDNNKSSAETPDLTTDLVTPGVYIKNTPVCPSGGDYLVKTLAEFPECTIGVTLGAEFPHTYE
jgi:Tfp pilus assembly protein PilE